MCGGGARVRVSLVLVHWAEKKTGVAKCTEKAVGVALRKKTMMPKTVLPAAPLEPRKAWRRATTIPAMITNAPK